MSKFEMFLQRATRVELEKAIVRQMKQMERMSDRLVAISDRLKDLLAEEALIKEDSD